MTISRFRVFGADETARLLPFPALMAAIETAAKQYTRGDIRAPERQVVPIGSGTGVMLSMPATAKDLAIHKLVNFVPGNRLRNLPTIQGIVTAYDSTTGEALFVLDGPTVTARRTASVSMLGLRALSAGPPRQIALIGTGKQAQSHVLAVAAVFPGVNVRVVGHDLAKARDFIGAFDDCPIELDAVASVPPDVDAVITTTTSKTPVYNLPAKVGRLIIGVGAFEPDSAEISAQTILASKIYVDDMAAARREAGDLLLSGVDWTDIEPLAHALCDAVDKARPIVFKTVGCATWDLAAARCARALA